MRDELSSTALEVLATISMGRKRSALKEMFEPLTIDEVVTVTGNGRSKQAIQAHVRKLEKIGMVKRVYKSVALNTERDSIRVRLFLLPTELARKTIFAK